MDAFEKIILAMRQEGANQNPPRIILGIMTSAKSCDTGKEVLDADDLYIAEHLVKHDEIVDVTEIGTLNADMNVAGDPAHKHTIDKVSSKNTKVMVHNKLRKGDVVALYRLTEEKYLILDKVVSMDVSI